MKKFYKVILMQFVISFFVVNYTNAGTGPATQYEIRMYKIELCEIGSTKDNCLNPLTISPDSTATVDIASFDAGAAAAAYGNLNAANAGTVYTYMQIVMKRAMQITGTAGNNCTTVAGNDGSLTASAVGQSGKTPGSATLYVGEDDSGSNTQYNGADNSDGSGASNDGIIEANDTYFQYRQKITGNLIIKDKIPTLKVAFDVSNAVGNATSTCTNAVMYAAEPGVTVTFD